MGIAELEPRQLAPSVGTTGSGSTDSPAPSLTTPKIDIDTVVDIAAPTNVDTTPKIDIDTVVGIAAPTKVDTASKIDIDTVVGIAAPTNVDTTPKIDIDTVVGIAVPTNVDTTSKIDIDTVVGIAVPTNVDATSTIDVDTIVGIAAPTNIDTASKIDINTVAGIAVSAVGIDNPMEPEVDAVNSTIVDNASPRTIDLTLAADVIDPASGATGITPGGYDMAFGLFNFHVDITGAVELLSIGESAPLSAEKIAPSTIRGKPSTNASPASMKENPKPEASTPSVGSNDFEDPPPSPTTAYCVDCDVYHYVGAGDFSSHEIAGCEDPQGGHSSCLPDDIRVRPGSQRPHTPRCSVRP
jgi:hypothetical protein